MFGGWATPAHLGQLRENISQCYSRVNVFDTL